ncbi:hypothetical protein Pcinc_008091 [Petrolisthes cinctipes]|uniref:Transposase Tc1-like domain-containing protein n=1 Tax=Petrolisthes cinctipes TaxID=88211 RepID=A0AAE1KXV9_PETCI|nr:hypothetical protein Pcinc_008091 [Petrolisthes cinctipes]
MTLKVVQRQVEFNPKITAKEIKEKNPQPLQGASVRTIQRLLRDDLHFDHRSFRRKPLVTEVQRKKRINFCKKYLEWDAEKWKNIVE